MSTSRETDFLSDVAGEGRIPEAKIAYFEQRALNAFYDHVIGRFEQERASGGLTKAKLANRIGRGQDQVNRLLANPGNWTIGTVARLLLGIGGEEPTLGSRPIAGRNPVNITVSDLLDGYPATISGTGPVSSTSSSSPRVDITINEAA